MFKKLVTNLPFNPSLFGQVAFYAGRMKKEASVRRLGFLFIALAMFIQLFAVMSPPEKSLAYSDDYIINGLTTRDTILKEWDRAGSDVSKIYGKFGVTRADIAKLPQYTNTTIRSNDGTDYWTIGRNSLSGYSNVAKQYKNTEVTINAGGSTVYMRQLRAWDIRNPYNTYAAWRGVKASDGSTFWILKDCGNYTQGKPTTKPTPKIEIKKSIKGAPASLKPGETMTFRFEWRNPVPDSLAENVQLRDELDLKNFDVLSPTGLDINKSSGLLTYKIGNVPFSANYHVLEITARLKNPLANGVKVCNVARATGTGIDVWSNTVCTSVLNPCVFNPSLPSNSPECITPELVCKLTTGVIKKGTRDVSLTTVATSSNQALTKIVNYSYDFGDGSKKQTVASNAYSNTVNHTYGTGDFTATVTVNYTITEGAKTTAKSSNCSSPIDFEAEKPVGQTKTVKNVTQNLEGQKALESKVNAGDVLDYTLTTINSSAYNKTDYIVSDYIGDILDYADLDQEVMAKEKAVYNKDNKTIQWPKEVLAANSEVVHSFRVKIKNPIPATNSPSALTTSFDCKISNKYGNELTMNVSCPLVKSLETLPNTGPGASLIAGFTIMSVIGYFFARSRLLAKELDIIKHDHVAMGY